jgi:hypothetical protein
MKQNHCVPLEIIFKSEKEDRNLSKQDRDLNRINLMRRKVLFSSHTLKNYRFKGCKNTKHVAFHFQPIALLRLNTMRITKTEDKKSKRE